MIYDKLANIGLYFDDDSVIMKALAYLKEHPSESGKVVLEEDKLFLNYDKYRTSSEVGKAFEAHRKYVDLQIMLEGSEMHGVMPLDRGNLATTDEYDEVRDIEFFDTVSEYSRIILSPGEFVVYFPDDCHKPGCSIGADTEVSKVVAKISAGELVTKM